MENKIILPKRILLFARDCSPISVKRSEQNCIKIEMADNLTIILKSSSSIPDNSFIVLKKSKVLSR